MSQVWMILTGVAVLLTAAVGVLAYVLRRPAENLGSEKQEALLREITQLSNQVQTLHVQKESLEQEKLQLKQDQEKLIQSCQVQFENVATKIFNAQKEMNRAEITHLLRPFNEQLTEFALRQTKDKADLANQIDKVVQANGKIQEITDQFVNALLNKPHFRGEWGEEALRTLLTSMGLRENQHFFQQIVGEEDKRPDFIVLLPNKQAVIIDAKTIWDKYYEYMKAENPSEKNTLLKEHVANIKSTISSLATKKYRKTLAKFYASVHTDMPEEPVGLVLMFVNPEAALSCAIEQDPSIIQEAREKKIALVSTTTLISTLQIIESLWVNYTVQESNEEIKNLAEKLVLDLGRFFSQYVQLAKHLQTATDLYNQSVAMVGENNKTGLLLTAQQLADLCPTADLSKADKKALQGTGFDGTKHQADAAGAK